jgi:hypothetical protein
MVAEILKRIQDQLQLTNSKEHSYSWKAVSHQISQEIPCPLGRATRRFLSSDI